MLQVIELVNPFLFLRVAHVWYDAAAEVHSEAVVVANQFRRIGVFKVFNRIVLSERTPESGNHRVGVGKTFAEPA